MSSQGEEPPSQNLDEVANDPIVHFTGCENGDGDLCTGEAKPGKRYRGFVFTVNNYTDDDVDGLSEMFEAGKLRYMVVSKEIAPSTGTPHLQGYLYYKSACTWESLRKKLFGKRAYIAIAKGNAEQNEQYVKKTRAKDEVPNAEVFEFGERPMTSKEKGETEIDRYQRAKDLAVDGNIDDVDADIFVRHYTTLKRIRDDALLSQELPEVNEFANQWYYGESGSGKSYTARERYPNAYLKMCNKWWQGYAGEREVLIEDFDKRHEVLIHHLKIWSDRYPFICEVKGSGVKIRPEKIIVTSNYHPEQIWSESSDLEPILRRFNLVRFDGAFRPPARPKISSPDTTDLELMAELAEQNQR